MSIAEVNYQNFVSTICSDKDVYILFGEKLDTINKRLNDLNISYYQYTGTSEQDNILFEEVNIPSVPCLVHFKDNNFKRYLNKSLLKADIRKFFKIKE